MAPWEEDINWGVVAQLELLYPGFSKMLKAMKVEKVINPTKLYASTGESVTGAIFLSPNSTLDSKEFSEVIFVKDGVLINNWIVRAGNIYSKLAWGLGTSY